MVKPISTAKADKQRASLGMTPLPADLLADLERAVGRSNRDTVRRAAGVAPTTLRLAMQGYSVRPATHAALRLGLERMEAEEKNRASVAAPPKNAFPWSPHLTPEMKAAFASGASALVRAPVCPRCLDLTPGTPAGGPETPHPGPFTEELCAACSRAVERDLRKEGRIQAADFAAKRREKAVKP